MFREEKSIFGLSPTQVKQLTETRMRSIVERIRYDLETKSKKFKELFPRWVLKHQKLQQEIDTLLLHQVGWDIRTGGKELTYRDLKKVLSNLKYLLYAYVKYQCVDLFRNISAKFDEYCLRESFGDPLNGVETIFVWRTEDVGHDRRNNKTFHPDFTFTLSDPSFFRFSTDNRDMNKIVVKFTDYEGRIDRGTEAIARPNDMAILAVKISYGKYVLFFLRAMDINKYWRYGLGTVSRYKQNVYGYGVFVEKGTAIHSKLYPKHAKQLLSFVRDTVTSPVSIACYKDGDELMKHVSEQVLPRQTVGLVTIGSKHMFNHIMRYSNDDLKMREFYLKMYDLYNNMFRKPEYLRPNLFTYQMIYKACTMVRRTGELDYVTFSNMIDEQAVLP